MTQALELLGKTQKKEKAQELILKIYHKLIDGMSFSSALENEKVFTSYECQVLKIGEKSGKLSKVLTALSEYYRNKNLQFKELRNTLTYPIIVLITAIIVVGFMLRFVVPMFENIFKQHQVSLPWITQQIVNASAFLEKRFWWIITFCILISIAIKYICTQKWFVSPLSYGVLKIPFFGDYIKNIHLSRCLQALSLLISTQVSLQKSIRFTKETIDFLPLKNALQDIEQQILNGSTLYEAFSMHSQIFDKKTTTLVRVAEQTHQAEYVFEKLNEQHQQKLKLQYENLINILNPALTLFIGFLVGIILVAMYLPMFKLSTVISA